MRPAEVVPTGGAAVYRSQTWLGSTVLMALALTVLLHAVAFACFTPFFASNDDGVMSLMAKGSWKGSVAPSEHLVFINIILGLGLKQLYLRWPGVHWYALALFAVFFASTWASAWALLSVRRSRLAMAAFLMLFIAIFVQFFAHFHFTIVSIWSAQAGVFVALGRSSRPLGRARFLVAGLLLLTSSLIRFDGFALSLATAVPFLILSARANARGERIKLAIFAAVLACAIGGAHWFHRHAYQSSPGLSQVVPALTVSSNLMEFRDVKGLPDTPRRLAAAGWTPLEFELLGFRFWHDPKFTLDNLRRLDESLGPVFAGKKPGLSQVFRDRFARILLLCMLMSAAFLPWRWYVRGLANLVWVLLVLSYLFAFKKLTVWVIWPAASYAVLLAFMDLTPAQPATPAWPRLPRWAPRLALALVATMSTYLVARVWSDNRTQRRQEQAMESDLRALAPRPEHLYLVSSMEGGFPLEAISVFGNYDLFDGFSAHRLSWEQDTPREREILNRFHVRDLSRDLVDRPDVFVIASDRFRTLYAEYVASRQGVRVAYQPVFQGTSFTVDRVVRVAGDGSAR